jgi:hypothetical protein
MIADQNGPVDLLELALTRCLLAYQEGHTFQEALEAGRMVLELEQAFDQTVPSGGLLPNSLSAGTGRLTK